MPAAIADAICALLDDRRGPCGASLGAGRTRSATFSWARSAAPSLLARALERGGHDERVRRHHHREPQHTRRNSTACLRSLHDAGRTPSGAHHRGRQRLDATAASKWCGARGHPCTRDRARSQRRVRRGEQRRASGVCQAPWVLLLNSDTVVPAGAIDTLHARLIARGVVAAGPRLVDDRGRARNLLWSDAHAVSRVPAADAHAPGQERGQPLRPRRGRAGYLADERLVDWVTGACLLLRARRRSRLPAASTNAISCTRRTWTCAPRCARAAARILFTPAAEVVHLRGRSGRGASRPTSGRPVVAL